MGSTCEGQWENSKQSQELVDMERRGPWNGSTPWFGNCCSSMGLVLSVNLSINNNNKNHRIVKVGKDL